MTAIPACIDCQHQHTGVEGACIAPVETTPPSEETDLCSCASRLYDVLIKTVVNVKYLQVPAASYEAALRRVENLGDDMFFDLFRSYSSNLSVPLPQHTFPQMVYTEWADENVWGLVDRLDPEDPTQYHEDNQEIVFKMVESSEGIDWQQHCPESQDNG